MNQKERTEKGKQKKPPNNFKNYSNEEHEFAI